MILVVEDDPLCLRLMRDMVRHLTGVVADVAESGNGALELISAKKYSLIITDVRMQPMSGDVMCRTLKTMPNGKDSTVVAVTAEASFVDLYDFSCFDAVYPKPVSFNDVKEILGITA